MEGCREGRLFTGSELDVTELDLTGLDTVIHLAGENIFSLWTREKKARILESRRQGTRAVVEAIARAKANVAAGGRAPSVLVSISAVGFYGDTGEREVDEGSPSGSGFLAEVCRVWEEEALQAERLGVRVVILRLGVVLGEGGGMLARVRPIFRLGLGGRLGSGRQWVSWIALPDLVRLMLEVAEREDARGVYNAVTPEPIRNADFIRALAERWHRPAPFAVPAFVLKTALGELSDMVLASQRVLPRRTGALPFHCGIVDPHQVPEKKF